MSKANKGHENLIPLNERTKEAQREIQSEGGIASAEVRRKRRALKETMDILLSMPIKDKRKLNKVAKMGLTDDDADNSALVVIALFDKAVSGDVPAIKELRSLIDEAGSETGQLEALIRGLKDDV